MNNNIYLMQVFLFFVGVSGRVSSGRVSRVRKTHSGQAPDGPGHDI